MKKEYIVANNGYTMIDGELVNVAFASKIARGEDIIYTTTNGREIVNAVTYASVEKFESGKRSEIKSSLPWILRDLRINENGEIEVWSMQNGEPTSVWKDVDARVFGYVNPILQEGEYLSREDCLKHNTYIEIDSQGNKVEHIGICKKLALNDEQKAFIANELTPALTKSKEIGLYLVFDNEYDTLRAINTKNIEVSLGSDYGTAPSNAMQICDLPRIESPLTCYSGEAYFYDELV